MKNVLFFVLIQLALSPAFATLTVRPGPGLAESNFVYGLQKVPTLLEKCLAEPVCGLTPSERDLATRIIALPGQQLVFADATAFSTAPSRAQFLEILKSPDPSTILVNLGQLYPNDQALTVMHAAAAILMLQSQALSAPDVARTFTNKILIAANGMANTFNLATFGFKDRGFSFSRLRGEPMLTFTDHIGTKNLTATLEQRLVCPSTVQTVLVTGVENWVWGTANTNSADRVVLPLQATVHYQCIQGVMFQNYTGVINSAVSLRLTSGFPGDFGKADPQFGFELITAAFEVSAVVPQ